MILKLISWCILLSFLFVVPSSHASDDILDILDGKKGASSSEALFQENNELTRALRKKIGRVTAEQNIFLSHLSQGKYEKALFQWGEAFSTTSFAKAPTGRALYSYLLFKNSLELNAVEDLLRITKPQRIIPELRNLWILLVPKDHSVWKVAQVTWQKDWTSILGAQIEMQIRSRQSYTAENSKEVYKLLKRTKANSYERSWLEWQMALGLSLEGDMTKAVKILSHLLKSKNSAIDKDLVNITAARLLFQQGYLSAAIKYYNKVPKSSEYWFVAKEESAWSYIRKGEPNNTLAVTQSLMPKSFKAQIGPESIFLRALAQLKMCDYKGVLATIKDFKTRFRPRTKKMLALQTNISSSKAVEALLEGLSKGRIKLLSLKSHANHLPSYVSRDEVLLGLAKKQFTLDKEAQLAGELYTKSLAGGSSKVGFDASFEFLKKELAKRAQLARSASYNRIKKLATEEIESTKQMLQKMHIVEAELIQQISASGRIVATSSKNIDIKKGTTGSKDKHALNFPYEGELWFDEIDNYNVDASKACQKKKAL